MASAPTLSSNRVAVWRQQRGRSVWIAAAGIGLVVVLSAVIGAWYRTSPFPVDAAVNFSVSHHRTELLVAISKWFATIGSGVVGDVVVPGLLVSLFLLARRWREACVFAAAIVLSVGLVQILKVVVHRARPPHGLVSEGSWSFPSGHSAHAATLVVVLVLLLRWRWLAAVGAVYALIMASSRVYLGVHWLTDVAAGLVFGASIAAIAVAIAGRIFRPSVQTG